MPYNPPTDESIKFLQTGAKDVFPTVYDAGNSSISEKYTKVWAEYHNKIRNFIGLVEPLCTTDTAQDAGMSSITYWTLNPAPSLYDIIYGFSKKAAVAGKAPPTTVYPFEIIITSSTSNYSNWSKAPGVNIVPMLYQTSSTNINKITRGGFFSIRPMVSCSIKSTSDSMHSTRWAVNSYCYSSSNTLCIRGSIIDLNGTAATTNQLPSIDTSFPNNKTQKLQVAIVGVRA